MAPMTSVNTLENLLNLQAAATLELKLHFSLVWGIGIKIDVFQCVPCLRDWQSNVQSALYKSRRSSARSVQCYYFQHEAQVQSKASAL